jgi:hypothetical protein
VKTLLTRISRPGVAVLLNRSDMMLISYFFYILKEQILIELAKWNEYKYMCKYGCNQIVLPSSMHGAESEAVSQN